MALVTVSMRSMSLNAKGMRMALAAFMHLTKLTFLFTPMPLTR